MVGVYMIEHVGTRAFKEGGTKIKEFIDTDPSVSIRLLLEGLNFNISKIKRIIEKKGMLTVYSEWLEGKDFQQIHRESSVSVEDYMNLGIFFAKLNEVRNKEGLRISSRDLFFKNFMKKTDGSVTLCDYANLYWTDFPEEDIVRWFINNYFLDKKYKDAFVKAYLKERNIDLEYIINKELQYNWDNYQDLYCNGKLLRSGPRSNKRLQFLPNDFTGLKVLDLGCSCGMFAREAKRRGADIVKAIDKCSKDPSHRLIDLSSVIAYSEGLDIYFLCCDIEDGLCLREDNYDIIFFCAILGHLKTDRLEYLKMLRKKCSTLYFETNLGGKELPHRKLLQETGFTDIECLGESGDPGRDPCNTYTMFKCKGDLR
jgi:2-polyprenyl-3-methyl-5-hydroxy-6-metoxy-1,4-benzoquinol methylase